MSVKIAVVGSGVAGRLLSMRLYQEGFTDISLFDKDDKHGTLSPATIAAGMLAPFCESVVGGKLIHVLGINSISLWREYLATLGSEELLNSKGTLLVAEPDFYVDAKHYMDKIGFYTGLDSSGDYYKSLDRAKLQDIEPELQFNQAYFLPDEGMLEAASTMESLGKYLDGLVNWRSNCEISEVSSEGVVVAANTNKHDKFDWVFDCRGVGAKEIFKDLRGVRGEVIRVHAPDVSISRPIRLFHPRHNIYIAPYRENHYVIGATEIEALDFSPISVRSTLELLTSLYSVHSGFAEARILSCSTNCRPTLLDNLPQIKLDNKLIAINGLYRHGFLVAPTLVEETINYIKTGIKEIKQVWS